MTCGELQEGVSGGALSCDHVQAPSGTVGSRPGCVLDVSGRVGAVVGTNIDYGAAGVLPTGDRATSLSASAVISSETRRSSFLRQRRGIFSSP